MICTGVAYEWVLEAPRPQGPDFTLIIACCRVPSDSPEPLQISQAVFHAKFPPAGQPFHLTDVSGTLGLLWHATDESAQEKANAFERMLADALVWSIGQLAFSPVEEHIVLVQGPLIPKLRGRHLYRGYDPRVPIFSVTFNVDWFRRIEAAQATFLKLPGGHAPSISNVYPPTAIDRATRSWICRLPGDADFAEPLHFEVIANMCNWSSDEVGGLWLDRCKEKIYDITTTAHLESVSADDDTRLPRALAIAVRHARMHKQIEEQFTKTFRAAEERIAIKGAMDRPGALKEMQNFFGSGVTQNVVSSADELLAVATTESAQLDVEQSYKHFTSNWFDPAFQKNLDSLLRPRVKRRAP
jgi:hypothetical protein